MTERTRISLSLSLDSWLASWLDNDTDIIFFIDFRPAVQSAGVGRGEREREREREGERDRDR